MDIPSNDLNGDCGCIHSDGFKSNKEEENISTFHNSSDSVHNEDFIQNSEELDPKTMEFEKLVQLMHPDFVSDYLTRILNFLKSDEYIISFPNIAPFKAAFLKKLVRKLEYKGFNDACKAVASEIIAVLDENKDVYKWIFTYDHGRFAKDVPAYRKIFYKKSSLNVHKFKTACTNAPKSSASESPKSSTSSVEELKIIKTNIFYRNQKNNSAEDVLNTTESTDISECSDVKSKPTSRMQRTHARRQKLIQELEPDFVETSLLSILSLVEDEMSASLILNDVTESAAKFYKSIVTLVKSRKTTNLFSRNCKFVLSQLKQKLDQSSKCWKIVFEEYITDRKNKLRDVTLTKVPIGESLSPNNLSMSEPPESVISRVSDCNRSIERSRDRSISNDRRGQPSWNGIEFECGGPLERAPNVNSAFKTQANGATGRKHRAVRKQLEFNSRKSRLLEGLSVPLECDKAMRMMRLMGWQGGALGPRGEGITEPIMPALNVVTGAGLGHCGQKAVTTKQHNPCKQKQSQRIPVEYRIDFLENVLALLRSDATERELAYSPPLSNKEERFMRMSLNAFNCKKKVGLNDVAEQELLKKISEEMLRNADLVLRRAMTEDSMLITLWKLTNTQVLPLKKNIKKLTSIENNRVQVFEQPDPSIKSELLTLEDVLSNLYKVELPNGVKKSTKFLAYRLCFLNRILNFLKSKDLQAEEYRFDRVLGYKYRKYLKTIIASVNLKDRIVAANHIESDILSEIIANHSGCYLDVTFSSGYQKFTLRKMFCKKDLINTSATQIADDKSSAANNNISVANDNSNSINDRNDTDDHTTVTNDDVQVVIVSTTDIPSYDTLESAQTEFAPIKNCKIREEPIKNETECEEHQSKDVDLRCGNTN